LSTGAAQQLNAGEITNNSFYVVFAGSAGRNLIFVIFANCDMHQNVTKFLQKFEFFGSFSKLARIYLHSI
jgi:hypothetical protein